MADNINPSISVTFAGDGNGGGVVMQDTKWNPPGIETSPQVNPETTNLIKTIGLFTVGALATRQSIRIVQTVNQYRGDYIAVNQLNNIVTLGSYLLNPIGAIESAITYQRDVGIADMRAQNLRDLTGFTNINGNRQRGSKI